MGLDTAILTQIPLFDRQSDQHLARLAELFTAKPMDAEQQLFAAGDDADELSVLTSGEIGLYEQDQLKLTVRPVAAIGELGAVLTGVQRNTTARALTASTLWQVRSTELRLFLKENPGVATPFYDTLLHFVADKTRRDQILIDDMRNNIIRTQKAMKRLRDLILESAEATISEPLHDTLEDLIAHNRRVNYRVEPPAALPCSLRLDGGDNIQVIEMSRHMLRLRCSPQWRPEALERLSGVLWLHTSDTELPVSGSVVELDERSCDLELDHLIESYSEILDAYLTRVQLLDFIV